MSSPHQFPADRYLAFVVQSSDEAIICNDRDGCITGFNRAAERILGYTASHVIGRENARRRSVSWLS